MDILIREYEKRDFRSCRQLWRELTQRHRDIYFDQSIGGDDPGAAFEEYLKKTSLAGLWVVEQKGLVLGMAGLLMDGNEAEVEPIVVRSDHRSQGIGNLLLERLKVEAKARGVGYLSIKPVARNVEAIQCFHRAGFSLLGHVDMFMELSGEKGQEWKESVTIHGHEFRY
jgi:GNAT superfamily N-acetyltransferase